MCPRLFLPGQLVAAARQMHHSSTIDGGDYRSIDDSKHCRHHGSQFFDVCTEAGRVDFPAPLSSNAVVLKFGMEQMRQEA